MNDASSSNVKLAKLLPGHREDKKIVAPTVVGAKQPSARLVTLSPSPSEVLGQSHQILTSAAAIQGAVKTEVPGQRSVTTGISRSIVRSASATGGSSTQNRDNSTMLPASSTAGPSDASIKHPGPYIKPNLRVVVTEYSVGAPDDQTISTKGSPTLGGGRKHLLQPEGGHLRSRANSVISHTSQGSGVAGSPTASIISAASSAVIPPNPFLVPPQRKEVVIPSSGTETAAAEVLSVEQKAAKMSINTAFMRDWFISNDTDYDQDN